jgi:hypothetical protein
MNNLAIDDSTVAESGNIVLHSNMTEMLRIDTNGFWVRGVKVDQDEREAGLVYQAFKEWLTWANLTRVY